MDLGVQTSFCCNLQIFDLFLIYLYASRLHFSPLLMEIIKLLTLEYSSCTLILQNAFSKPQISSAFVFLHSVLCVAANGQSYGFLEKMWQSSIFLKLKWISSIISLVFYYAKMESVSESKSVRTHIPKWHKKHPYLDTYFANKTIKVMLRASTNIFSLSMFCENCFMGAHTGVY